MIEKHTQRTTCRKVSPHPCPTCDAGGEDSSCTQGAGGCGRSRRGWDAGVLLSREPARGEEPVLEPVPSPGAGQASEPLWLLPLAPLCSVQSNPQTPRPLSLLCFSSGPNSCDFRTLITSSSFSANVVPIWGQEMSLRPAEGGDLKGNLLHPTGNLKGLPFP